MSLFIFKPTGVLLYGSQDNVPKGDFLSLNLINQQLQLRYNLGSGLANITLVRAQFLPLRKRMARNAFVVSPEHS